MDDSHPVVRQAQLGPVPRKVWEVEFRGQSRRGGVQAQGGLRRRRDEGAKCRALSEVEVPMPYCVRTEPVLLTDVERNGKPANIPIRLGRQPEPLAESRAQSPRHE